MALGNLHFMVKGVSLIGVRYAQKNNVGSFTGDHLVKERLPLDLQGAWRNTVHQ